ncbi:RagB/SusD family nutrient uptake outer membrane protein [Pontibacter sp. KCTC 32443]|uniref:RagB/SusD family nutrient uptake outer membrane protein n=1 Tax=Pontibacter TaxID=323449 RepID=UPI00164D91F1|nr:MULTISPECIES: RagB/SusD family nutrient uptake outer membrane protein [Pontibacter]MBC5775137.1 RagB/SusD family nutrient uptake outer membrane protein [Pontibacter sp. KCTC 32443]
MKLKNILLAFILTSSLGVTSCDDLLDVEPQQSIDARDAINTPEDLQGAVIGMYSILGEPELYGTNLLLLPELQGSEENLTWLGTFAGYRQVSLKNMTADNSEAQRTWITAYEGINLANIVLSKLDIMEDPDERDRVEGEALFVRGILHFELVRMYAKAWNDGDPTNANENPGIPIRLTPTTTEAEAAQLPTRGSVADVYAQVLEDLQAAKELLPERNDERANTYAASAFLSRVYLQQQNYAGARDEANRVIEEGGFELNPSVTSIFRNDNTAEAIFEIQQNDQNNAGSANDGLATFYADLEGIGRADISVNTEFSDENPNRYTTYDLYEEDDARLNQLFYEGFNFGAITTGKWTSPGQNIPVVRLAEMYLTRAEANFRLGTTVGATPLEDINTIRIRAGLNPLLIVTLDRILLERRLELAFEGFRIHDLKRTETDLIGRDPENGAEEYVIPWNAAELIYPIPRREIDASKGSLKQNEGY